MCSASCWPKTERMPKTCQHVGCITQAGYGVAGSRKVEFCSEHKKDGMVDLINKRCGHHGCTKRPSYGVAGSRKAEFCAEHKKNGMVDVKSKRCSHHGCNNSIIWRCRHHRERALHPTRRRWHGPPHCVNGQAQRRGCTGQQRERTSPCSSERRWQCPLCRRWRKAGGACFVVRPDRGFFQQEQRGKQASPLGWYWHPYGSNRSLWGPISGGRRFCVEANRCCGQDEGGGVFCRTARELVVLAGVTADMKIAQEEVFGPVMTIIKVPGNSDEECVKMINSSKYGLASSVFSGSSARAVKIGEAIHCGMTNINDFGVNYLVQSLPFGGVKDSGYGRFAGPEGLRACCLLKSVTVDRFPKIMGTVVPAPLQYPVAKSSTRFAASMTRMFYCPSLGEKTWAVIELIRASIGK